MAVILDDGHGMNREEFTQRWLVVGTESKATEDRTPKEDRNGLKRRPRQGQKGIGRLSCANLGPLLLLVSKRRRMPYIAALVDWHLFENPFINLSDIFVPVTEFDNFELLFQLLPDLAVSLSENITGGEDKARKQRIIEAWKKSDEQFGEEHQNNGVHTQKCFSQEILSRLSNISFTPEYFRDWSVATGSCEHGTALLVSDINYDLRAQLDERIPDLTADVARKRFFETLSSFVDPFFDANDPVDGGDDPEFSYVVRAWNGDTPRVVVGTNKQFDRYQVNALEHRIEGKIDTEGVFHGRVKAFGEWLPDNCVIEPPNELSIPHRSDSILGPLKLYIASMEFKQDNTTHAPAEFRFYQDLAEKYAGFMIFRDGLRVMPYGRTDNDFFDIEFRRSKNAGREFWNHRQMFGRLAISREHNPNLKDKAGREGLLDNRAAKTLKGLVANILMQSARRYFGSASEVRKELLSQISAENKRKRTEEARNRLRKRQKKEFRTKLRKFVQELPELALDVDNFKNNIEVQTDEELFEAQQKLDIFRERLSDKRLTEVPKNLGALEDIYAEFLNSFRSIQFSIEDVDKELNRIADRIKLSNPSALLQKQLSRQNTQIHKRIKSWTNTLYMLQREERQRIDGIIKQRYKSFHAEAAPLLHRYETDQTSYAETSKAINNLKQRMDEENRELFSSYIGALESLQESIDLENLAIFGMEEISELRIELERLNSLAQLGIAVEIVGHELQSYDEIIGSGLRNLPDEIRDSTAVRDIEFGYEGLTDQLRFLSPLRLAGEKIQRWISGSEIYTYVSEFFKLTLSKNHISFSATDSFQNLRIFDQRSRLYPVFINLLNNSIYWLGVSNQEDKQILFDIVGEEVVVSDNGPGISTEDIGSLFSLFFTRKVHGGRGVGLYLCRANLTAGGHVIRYESSTKKMPLSGANFLISFRGAEFDGE